MLATNHTVTEGRLTLNIAIKYLRLSRVVYFLLKTATARKSRFLLSFSLLLESDVLFPLNKALCINQQ